MPGTIDAAQHAAENVVGHLRDLPLGVSALNKQTERVRAARRWTACRIQD